MAHFFEAKTLRDYNKSILPKLQDLSAPLKLFGISNFAYVKITKDQRYFRIGTHEAYTNLFFEQDLYNNYSTYRSLVTPDTFSQGSKPQYFLWNTNKSSGAGDVRLAAGMWNGITIYLPTKDYLEIWAFGGTLEDTELSNFYLNNLDLLKRFLLYFRSTAKDLIDISDPKKTIHIQFHEPHLTSSQLDSEKLKEFNEKIRTNKYCFPKGQDQFCLTSREVQCLSYKSKGLTAKEIARIYQISPRTIETHFDHIKIKSGVRNIKQLLLLFKDEGVL